MERDAAQVEDREAEGRRQEARLQVHADDDAEPDGIHAEMSRTGAVIGITMKMISNVSRMKPSTNISAITTSTAPTTPARQVGEEVVDEVVAAHQAEDDREDRGAEQDDEDHRADRAVEMHDLAQDAQGQAPAQRRQNVAPTAPTEAASVGVAMPPRIEPSTDATSSSGGTAR
jgi:hypothetical protein